MFPQDLHDLLRTINSPGNGPTSDICAFPGLVTSANNMTLGYIGIHWAIDRSGDPTPGAAGALCAARPQPIDL